MYNSSQEKMIKAFKVLILTMVTYSLCAQPVITTVSNSSSGIVGASITLTGTGFNSTAANNKVFFGSALASVTSASTTQLVVTVPHGATHAPITVVTGGKSGQSKFPFKLLNPIIASRVPNGSNFGNNILIASIGTNHNYDISIGAGDFNADGKSDVVKGGTNLVSVHANQYSGSGLIASNTFSSGTTFAVTGTVRSLQVADIDSDGDLDIITAGGATISVLRNNTSTSTISFASKEDFSSTASFIRIADMNRDGKMDIVALEGSNLKIFINTTTTGSLSFSASTVALGSTYSGLDVADMNSDGKMDAIVTVSGTTGFVINTTTGTTWSNATVFTVAYGHNTIVAADLDNDGDNDLFVYNSLLQNNFSTGTISGNDFIKFGNNQATDGDNVSKSAADFNGDGFTDIYSATTWDKTWLYGNAGAGFNGASTFNSKWSGRQNVYAGVSGATIGVDLNNDGKVDVLSARRSSNSDFCVVENLMQGTPTITTSGTLSAFTACANTASTSSSFTVSGISLTADISLAAVTGFEYSTNNSTWSTTLTLTQSGGVVNTTTVYVRMAALSSSPTSGNITLSSTGATNKTVAVSGTVNPNPTITGTTTVLKNSTTSLTGSANAHASTPWTSSNTTIATVNNSGVVTGKSAGTATITYRNTNGCTTTTTVTVFDPVITVSTTSLSSVSTCTSPVTYSNGSFSVSGTNLAANITVTAPTNFEVSTSSTTGFGTTVTLTQSSGTVATTTVFVRAKSSATTGSLSGTATVTSTSATQRNIALTGSSQSGIPVVTPAGNSRCGAGTVNLTASATNGGTLAWYSVSTNGSSLANGSSYQPSVSVGTTTFYVEASNGCGSSVSRASAIATANALPDAPTVTNGQRCGTGTVALSATTGAGNTIRWYASGGTTVLTTGTSYTTPSISSTTNYDVEVVSADGCVSATKSLATATVSNTATWNSASSQSWTTAGNWSCGTVPNGSVSLVISTGTATLSSDLSMASGTTLTLSSGAQLVIEPGHALTIQDGATFSNAGTILVDANSSDYGQLLLQGTYTKVGSGKVQVKGYYDVDGNNASPWVHVSSPVSGALGQLGTVTTGNTQGWLASTASWIGMRTDSVFTAGKGYITYIGTNGVVAGPNGTFSLEGDPFDNVTPRLAYNSGSGSAATFVDVNNRGGWNLLGNPFTCNLDYVALQSTISGLNSSFARWNPKKGGPGLGGFDVHAPAGAGDMGTAVIPPMGAAWVQTSAAQAPVASGALKHKDHGRRNSRNFSKGTGVDKLLITVSELASPQIQDEMTLAMVPGAVDGFDSEWDGRELLNSLYMPNIYSKFDQDKISAKAVDFNLNSVSPKTIPVGMKSVFEMRPYRLHIDATWSQPGYTVYLRDLHLNQVHKLSTSDYIFAYTSAMEDRFELILTNAKTGALGLEEASRGALTAWVSGSELWITGLESGAQELDVVGMDGRVVLSTALRAEEGQPATTLLPELPVGLYTVRVRANGLERGVRVAVQR